jgi:hypothetical protein
MLDDPRSLGSVFHLPSVVQRASQTSFVVVIPVKDEEERLPACLEALARQRSFGAANSAKAYPCCALC